MEPPYHGPLPGFDSHLGVAALLRIQGCHEGPDRGAADHVNRDAGFVQGPDDPHLGTPSAEMQDRDGKGGKGKFKTKVLKNLN